MKLTDDEIRSAIKAWEIVAVTLDTSILDAAKHGLEWGVLKRMQQFKSSNRFLLSEIVIGELRAHLIKNATTAQKTFKDATRELGNTWGASEQDRLALQSTAFGKLTPVQISEQRIQKYLQDTAAKVISSETVSTSDLVKMYFANQAPFADKDSKKHEFPDAIALLALEDWAKQNGQILVVTKDGDWKKFCEDSEHLVVVDELGRAVSFFQEESASYLCSQYKEMLTDWPEFWEKANTYLKDSQDLISTSSDVDSYFYVETDMEEAVVQPVSLHSVIEGFEPIEYDDVEKRLVARITLLVPVELNVFLSFKKWDGIDKEYISMGGGTASDDTETIADLIITFEVKDKGKPGIEDIEVTFDGVHATFSDLDPDWMSDRSNFEE